VETLTVETPLNDQEKHDLFAQLFVRHQGRIYRYLLTLIPNRADAEDVFQETNLTLWRTWDRYDPSREFLPWAYAVAHNHARNYFRTRHHRALSFRDDLLEQLTCMRVTYDELLERRQVALTRCLEKLNPHQQELVERYYRQEESIKTVAKREGRSPEAVYKAMQRIRTVLFDCINQTLALGGVDL
jgi:RNA polymerase sigma-70 factor (ECF subfamily)